LAADEITAFTVSGGGTGLGTTFQGFSAQFTAVPEPGTYALLIGIGALGVVGLRRRLQC
jgi:hypothetical protein